MNTVKSYHLEKKIYSPYIFESSSQYLFQEKTQNYRISMQAYLLGSVEPNCLQATQLAHIKYPNPFRMRLVVTVCFQLSNPRTLTPKAHRTPVRTGKQRYEKLSDNLPETADFRVQSLNRTSGISQDRGHVLHFGRESSRIFVLSYSISWTAKKEACRDGALYGVVHTNKSFVVTRVLLRSFCVERELTKDQPVRARHSVLLLRS